MGDYYMKFKFLVLITSLGLFAPMVAQSETEQKSFGAGIREVPPGLVGEDAANFNHLSEGADIYPYEWLVALESATASKDGSMFLENLDKKFGVIKITDNTELITKNSEGKTVQFLMRYVGLSATWSDEHPTNADAFKEDFLNRKKTIKQSFSGNDKVLYQEIEDINNIKVKSIRMVGTNCSFCHTSEIHVKKGGQIFPIRIDGAPNMLDVRGYFKDMMASTIAVLSNETKMKEFLDRMGVADSTKKSKALTSEFIENFGVATGKYLSTHLIKSIPSADKLSMLLTLGKARIGTEVKKRILSLGLDTIMADRKLKELYDLKPTDRLYKGSKAIAQSLKSLLRVTYGFKDDDNIGELEKRMDYLGNMMVGNSPMISETIAGFGRTDAFGRISNLVLRGDNPVDLTGEVSYPWIWGIKYKAMLHYNGNTNSVVLRNVGQSLGLGATIREDGLATSNVYNLDRLEHLVHKIKFPQWEEVFKNIPGYEMKSELLPLGWKLYMANCASCHESNKLVGPRSDENGKGRLRDYNTHVFQTNLKQIDKIKKGHFHADDTDPMTAINATLPIIQNGKKLPFEDVIFNAVSGLKEKYYKKFNFSEDQKAKYEFRDIRGNEFFRDTLFGYSEGKMAAKGNNYGKIRTKSGYIAKPLAGIWATAPYLHNGSVPTLMDLLKPAKDRPKRFNVKSRELDPKLLGYVGYDRNDKKCAVNEESTCFDVSNEGNSNKGHEYGVDLSENEKMALLEYLKVLAPDVEYSWAQWSREDDNEPNKFEEEDAGSGDFSSKVEKDKKIKKNEKVKKIKK